MPENPYGLSAQDIQDLRQIAAGLPAGDPRQKKISLLINSVPTQFEQEQNAPRTGVLGTIGGVLKKGGQMIAGAAQTALAVSDAAHGNPIPLATAAVDTVENIRRADAATPTSQTVKPSHPAYRMPMVGGAGTFSDINQNVPERAGMVAGAALGADTPKMASDLRRRDIGGAIVESTPLVAAAVAPEITRRVGGVAGRVANAVRSPGAQAAVMPEAANLPPQAISGAEDVFRAAAPTGMNQGFRAQLYNAAGDLAEIGRKVALDEKAGGIRTPDMRVRATVNAINDHLSEMYQNEVVPQFEKAPNAQVTPDFGSDGTTGLQYIARNAGEQATRNLAARAANGEPLTLPETYELAKVVNSELRGYESMTPAEKAALGETSRKFGGLKVADRVLSQSINQTLKGFGEPGIEAFERRYAALSSVRDQLSTRFNAVELNQPGVIKAVAKPVASIFTGGKSGIASASQAAVADVNIGRMLQRGFQRLADSGITADRGIAVQPNVRGMLGPGAIQVGPAPEANVPMANAPAWSPTTRAQRLGLMLPDQTGGPIELEYVPQMTPGEQAASTMQQLRQPAPRALPQRGTPIMLGPSELSPAEKLAAAMKIYKQARGRITPQQAMARVEAGLAR
jgi:hypothetical protein